MTSLLELTIPGPPRGAQRAASSRNGRGRFHTSEHHAAERLIRDLAALYWRGRGALDQPVRVVIETWHRRPKSISLAQRWWNSPAAPFVGKPDADNVAKLVLDALTKAGVWVDDTRVAELVVRRRWCAVDEQGRQEPERTAVRVEGLP